MATSDRTIHGATAEVNLTGLESSLIELVRWDGDVLKFNDVSSPTVADVTRVTQIDGLFDDAPLRQERVARPDTYGTNPGIPFYDEKLISLTGYVKAGNFPMLRSLQRAIKKSLSFKTISYADLETWTLRITTPSSDQYFMLNVQPASIQMPEQQDSAEYKRPFLITLKASDPRIYSAEATITALVAATQSRDYYVNSSGYSNHSLAEHTAYERYDEIGSSALGTSKYVLAHVLPMNQWPAYAPAPDGVGLSLDVVPTNPSFDTNTTGWTPTTSTITRDTGTYDTSPASGRWDNTGASDNLGIGDQLSVAFTGTFLAGVLYALNFKIKMSGTGDASLPLVSQFGHIASGDFIYGGNPATLHGGDWTDVWISWTPASDRTGVVLILASGTTNRYYNIDTMQVFYAPAPSRAGVFLQRIDSTNYLRLALNAYDNTITLVKYDSGVSTLLHTFSLPYESRNKDVYIRAYMASSSSVACQAYTSRPFTVANKASEPDILLDSSYTLTGGDLTKFGGTVTGMKRGVWFRETRGSNPNYPWYTIADGEVNDVSESPLSQSFTIGGDVPSPIRCRIDGPIVDPTVRITQTGGSSPVAFAEDISFLLYTTLTSGQYVEWDPWTNTWTHSAGGSVLTATGNRYSDLTPGTYTAVLRGSGTDTTHSALTIYTRAAIS